MKRCLKSMACKFPALALLIVGLALVTVATGCGNETDKANLLVGEVNDILTANVPKKNEAETLLTQAASQLRASQIDAEKASLTKAQQLLDEIIPEYMRAKQKTDEASALKISDNYRQYLQAKAASLDASIRVTQANREYTVIILADAVLEKPETVARINELTATINDQITKINEAEAEANRIAAENSDEIEQ